MQSVHFQTGWAVCQKGISRLDILLVRKIGAPILKQILQQKSYESITSQGPSPQRSLPFAKL